MNDIVAKQQTQIKPIGIDPEALILKALENNVPVETLERLLSMRVILKEEQAKEAFFTAMSDFQSKCPIIKKNKEVFNKDGRTVRYRYATLDSIIDQVSPILKECGLSYSFKAEYPEGAIIQTCEVHHSLGHSEKSSFSAPIDVDAFMGDAQKSGSASTFAKRYAFTNAFGILTGDQDDDAQSLGQNVDQTQLFRNFRAHMDTLWKHIDTIKAVKEFLEQDMLENAAECWTEITDFKDISWLSLAPTKGGCFTIEEKRKMKSDDFKIYESEYRKGRPIVGY